MASIAFTAFIVSKLSASDFNYSSSLLSQSENSARARSLANKALSSSRPAFSVALLPSLLHVFNLRRPFFLLFLLRFSRVHLFKWHYDTLRNDVTLHLLSRYENFIIGFRLQFLCNPFGQVFNNVLVRYIPFLCIRLTLRHPLLEGEGKIERERGRKNERSHKSQFNVWLVICYFLLFGLIFFQHLTNNGAFIYEHSSYSI